MKSLEEIEEEYKVEKEKLEKRFLDTLKSLDSKTDLKALEEKYKKDFEKIIQNYQNKVADYIKKSKKKPKLKQFRIIHTKPLQIKSLNMERSKRQTLKIKWSIFSFKAKIMIKKIFHKIYYPHPAYLFKKLKAKIKELV